MAVGKLNESIEGDRAGTEQKLHEEATFEKSAQNQETNPSYTSS